jgi:hypothetical protein
MSRLPLQGTYQHASGTPATESDEDRREWVVPIDWENAVPRDQALWRAGFFANQNPACKLRAHFTIDEVSRHFDVVPGEVLAEDTRFELVRGCPQHASNCPHGRLGAFVGVPGAG